MTPGYPEPAPPAPRRGVNLLPPEAQERQRLASLRRRLGAVLAAAVAVVAIATGVTWRQAQIEQEGVNRARGEQDRLLATSATYAEVTRVVADLERTEGRLAPELARDVRWSRYLGDVSNAIPESTWLLYLAAVADAPAPDGSVGQVRFTGRAFRHADVAAFLTALSSVRGTSAPYLGDSTARQDEAGRDVVEFNAYATLTAAALSSRYAARTGE